MNSSGNSTLTTAAPDSRDSVERIVEELRAYEGDPFGTARHVFRGWADRLQALARGPQQAGGEDWQLIDGKRSADGLAYTAVYWCANTGALKTETTSDGRFRAGDGPRIRRPKGYAALNGGQDDA